MWFVGDRGHQWQLEAAKLESRRLLRHKAHFPSLSGHYQGSLPQGV